MSSDSDSNNEISPIDALIRFYRGRVKQLEEDEDYRKYTRTYNIYGRKIILDQTQEFYIRPIAETLAMLDGNAFFGSGGGANSQYGEWWMQYAADAIVLWEANGGLNGWPSESLTGNLVKHENDQVREAFENWLMLKKLARDSSRS
jgi:hypothetical protein